MKVGDIPLKPGETRRTVTESCGQLSASKLDSLGEMEEPEKHVSHLR